MGDVVRTVVGWIERLRGGGQAETVFVPAGVQGLMGVEGETKRKPPKPRLYQCTPDAWACGGMVAGRACIGLGDKPASAWECWRRAHPWWRRWLVPKARAPKWRGHWPAVRRR